MKALSPPNPRLKGSFFRKFREDFRVFFFYLKKYRSYYAIGLGSLVVVDTLEAVPPLLVKRVVDGLTDLHDSQRLHRMILGAAGIYIAISFVQGYMRFLWRKYIVRTSMLASNDMRQELFAHLTVIAPAFFKKKRVGDLVSLATNDIESIRFALGPGALTMFDALFYFLVIPPIMFSISPKLTLLAFLPLICVPFFTRRMESVIQKHFKAVQDRFSDLAAHCQEALSGIRVIKGAALEAAQEKELEELGRNYVKANVQSAFSQSFFTTALDFFVSVSTTILFLVGGAAVLKEKISIGIFVAFQRYIQKMAWPMEGFGLATNFFQRSLASQKRVDEVLLEESGILPASSGEPRSREGKGRQVPFVEVRNLSFTYPGSTIPALRNVSFTLKSGMKLGLAGGVGSGKTCLLSCLSRMEPVANGHIFFDGVDVNELSLEYVRRKIGYVPQEVFLFSRSIADNILYGSPIFQDESPIVRLSAAREKADIANVRKDIEGLMDGFDTMLGERGVNLSGGQKQRVSIARALARNPEILLLDDCLSAVDAETERRLIDSLQTAATDMSLVISSHRLSSFDRLDWVLVLDGGRMVEQGPPHELKSRSANFSELYRQQEMQARLEELELVK